MTNFQPLSPAIAFVCDHASYFNWALVIFSLSLMLLCLIASGGERDGDE